MPKRLSDAQQQHAVRHLNAHLSSPRCPQCNASNLRVQPLLTSIPVATEPGEDAQGIEAVNVICNYCGYIMQFAAEPIGIFDVEASGNEEDAASSPDTESDAADSA
jgi:hypothetical protein